MQCTSLPTFAMVAQAVFLLEHGPRDRVTDAADVAYCRSNITNEIHWVRSTLAKSKG